MPFTKLDPEVIDLLRCPLAKAPLLLKNSKFICDESGMEYPAATIQHRTHSEAIYDFRIHRPAYALPAGHARWIEAQQTYENWSAEQGVSDDAVIYAAEIDSVREIYTEVYHLNGCVLDVGGHQGRLRHFLGEDVSLYVSVDPALDIFRGVENQPHLLDAFPSLSTPCNFLSCTAEYLPFASSSFDWVHMRSVLDHFADPYLALKEAYRVLKPGGQLMIGVSILERIPKPPAPPPLQGTRLSRALNMLQKEGLLKVGQTAALRLKQSITARLPQKPPPPPVEDREHIFHLRYEDLLDLVRVTQFRLTREHWQKAPYTYVLYLTATAGQK